MRKSVSKQYTKKHFIYLSKLYIVHCPWTIGGPLWPERFPSYNLYFYLYTTYIKLFEEHNENI